MKQLKFFVLLASILAISSLSWSQVSAYSFASSSGAYTEITGGNVLGTGAVDYVSTAQNIGFTFTYNEVDYTQLVVCGNGFIALGTTATTATQPLGAGATNNVISAFGRGLQQYAGGSLRAELTGTAPNRVYVIQWKNYGRQSLSGDNFNFQLRLSETSNKIEFVYGTVTTGSTSLTSGAQVGLRGATSSDFNNRAVATGGSWDASTAGTANTAFCITTTTVVPANGLTYTYSINATAPKIITAPNSLGFGYIANGSTSPEQTISVSAINLVGAPGTLTVSATGGFEVSLTSGSGFATTIDLPFSAATLNATNIYARFAPTANQNYTGTITITGGTAPAKTVAVTGTSNADFLMSNAPVTTCSGNFYDSGNSTGQYASSENFTKVFTPATATYKMKINFTSFNTEATYDKITIYDNNTATGTKLLDAYSGTTLPTGNPFVATNPTGALTVVFTSDGSGTRDGWAATLSCDPPPSCPKPGSLSATTNSSSATLSWVNGASETSWVIEWGLSTFTHGSGTMVTVNSNPYTLNGLTPSTSYKYYVRAYCAVGDSSLWAGPFSFGTTQVLATIPYVQNFESGFDGAFANGTQTNKWFVGTLAAAVHAGTQSAYITNDNGVSNAYTITSATVAHAYRDIQFTAGAPAFNLNFWWKAQGESSSDYLTVYLVDPNITPVAGTQLDAASIIGSAKYNLQGTWQNVNIQIPNTVAGSNKRLVFSWRNDGSIGTQPPVAIDDINLTVLTCPAPSALTATGITTNSANLGWTASGTATAWDIEYGITGFAQGTAAGTIVTATATNPHNLTGLAPSTTYSFYVRSNCGGTDISSWAGPFSFSTQCADIDAFSQSFDAVTTPAFPVCWAKVGTTGTANTQTTSFLSSPNCLYIYSGTTTSKAVVSMPSLSNAGAGTHWLRFQARANYTVGGVIEVGYLTNPTDATTFVSVQSVTITALTYNEYTVDLGTNPGTNKVLAFRHTGSPANSVLIDDVVWEPKPVCLKPTVLTATPSNISADLSWTNGGTETAWNIQWGIPGFTLGTGTIVAVTAKPYTLSGLTASTAYSYYVQADCGAGSTSTWAGPFNFTTTACPITDQCAFTLSMTDSYGDGWNGASVQVKQNGVSIGTYTLTSGQSTSTATINLCNTANIDLIWTEGSYPDECSIIFKDPFDVTLTSFTAGNAPTTGTTFFTFAANCTPPACPVPQTVTTTTTDATAIINWTQLGTPTSWNVEYGTPGFTQGTGTTVVLTTNPDTLTGLTPASNYSFYIQANCGAGTTSTWVGPFTFATQCVPLTATYTQNFDGVTTPALPNCWTKKIVSTNTYVTVGTSTTNSSAPNSASLYNSGATATDAIILVSPTFSDLPNHTNQIRFKVSGAGSIIVGTMTDPNDAATFTAYQTIVGITSTFVEKEISFAAYTGTGQYIAFKHACASTYQTIYIDDFVYEPIPTCPKPTALTATGNTTTSVNLGWTIGASETAWSIQYGSEGFALGTGTIINNITTNPYTLSALSPASTYAFYVRAICGAGDTSIWNGPLSFPTLCNIVGSFPYTQNFESTSIPNCWSEVKTPTTSTYGWATTTPGYDGNGFRFDSYMNSTGNKSLLKSCVFDFSAQTTMQMSFWWKNPTGGNFKVVISTDGGTTFSTTALADNMTAQTAWSEKIIDISAYSGAGFNNVVIGFEGTSNYGSGDAYIYLDKLYIGLPPTCLAPSALTATSISANTANLGWTANGTATTWDIEWGAQGFTQGTGTIITATTTNPHNLTGLTPATNYSFYVRSNCGGTDVSIWTGPFNFTTTQIPATIPYTQGFETGFDGAIVNGTQTNKWFVGALAAAAHAGTQSAYITNNNGVGNAYTTSSTTVAHAYRDVQFTAGAPAFNLNFWWKAQGESTYDYLTVYLVDPSVTPVAGTQLDAASIIGNARYNLQSTWQNVNIQIPNTAAGSIKRLVFSWKNDGSGGTQPPVAIDDINLTVLTCPAPSALTATTTDITANLGWTENGTANNWEIEWDTLNFVHGTGHLISGVNTNPHTITGLSATTDYSFYVRSVCGAGDSSAWVGPFNFTTSCAYVSTFPYLEEFTASTMPPACWSARSGLLEASSTLTGTTSSWGSDIFANAGTNNSAKINIYGTSKIDWLISPTINLGSGSYNVEFDLALTEWNGTLAATLGDDDKFAVVISTDNGATWSNANILREWNSTTPISETLEHISISLLGYSGNVKIGLYGESTESNEDNDLFVDNFTITQASAEDQAINNAIQNTTLVLTPATTSAQAGSPIVVTGTVNYPTTFDAALPADLLVDMMFTTNVPLPNGATIQVSKGATNLGTYTSDGTGTPFWLSTEATGFIREALNTKANIQDVFTFTFNGFTSFNNYEVYVSLFTALDANFDVTTQRYLLEKDTAAITITVPVSYAVLPFTESFENVWIDKYATSDVPSAYWVNTPATGENSWRRDDEGVTSGAWATEGGAFTPTGANSTSHAARFHSSDADNLAEGTLDLYVNFSPAGIKELKFWHFNATGPDSLFIYLSEDGGTTFGAALAKYRTSTGVWQEKTVSLGSSSSATTVVRFKGLSDNGSSDVGIDEVRISYTVGVENLMDGQSIVSVYPNPNNGLFNIKVTNKQSSDLYFELRNIEGQVVFTKQVKSVLTYNDNLDLSNLAKGIYYLKVNNGTSVKFEKIIIQ